MTDTQAFTLRLPPDLYDKLRKAAFDQHTSMNALIIVAIREQHDELRLVTSGPVPPCRVRSCYA
jgi:hypothetical protein